jgi:hypothetical protein
MSWTAPIPLVAIETYTQMQIKEPDSAASFSGMSLVKAETHIAENVVFEIYYEDA